MIPLAIVGCGGMGHRHLYGLSELERSGLNQFELVAVCDPVRNNAESLASNAKEHLGVNPAVVSDLSELAAQVKGLRAIDICTDPASHHTLTVKAFEYGWHVMVEKPMGLTVKACNFMRRAAEESGLILSVAENYRRDPMARLSKALLDAGVIGKPRLLVEYSIGGSDLVLISAWRHQKHSSGLLLDVGVHYADMREYLLGEVETVYAQIRLHERIRRKPEGGATSSFYAQWQNQMPEKVTATAEDAAYVTMTFRDGVIGQLIEDHAGHGKGMWQRIIFGEKGSLELPGDRSGQPICLTLDGKEPISDERILDFVPGFRLDPTTTALFGGNRFWHYDLPFVEIDRKLIGFEYYDFAEAIRTNQPPEVDAHVGARAVALCYAIMESGSTGQVVSTDEILAEKLDTYQKEINIGLGLSLIQKTECKLKNS